MTYRRLAKAIRLAVRWHDGEDREGHHPLPYVTHPMEVLLNLRYVGGETDEDLLCAAALHDVVEETDVKVSEIADEVGERVGALVKELTRGEPPASETQGKSKDEIWQIRAELLLEEISKMSPAAQRVKLADRLSNLEDAYRTKQGYKLERYIWQTRRITEIVPREVCPGLWDAIVDKLPHPK